MTLLRNSVLLWTIVTTTFFWTTTMRLVVRETGFSHEVPQFNWQQVNPKALALAVLLLPVALLLFRLGTGFDGWVKLAVATTIVQWVLLVEGVGRLAGFAR